MKKLFLFFTLTLFFFSCSTANESISDVCGITQEICYYANMICDNYDSTFTTKSDLQDLRNELKLVSGYLKLEYNRDQNRKSFSGSLNNFDTKSLLVYSRDQLIQIYSHQKFLNKK